MPLSAPVFACVDYFPFLTDASNLRNRTTFYHTLGAAATAAAGPAGRCHRVPPRLSCSPRVLPWCTPAPPSAPVHACLPPAHTSTPPCCPTPPPTHTHTPPPPPPPTHPPTTAARLLFMEDTPAKFKSFVAPLQQVGLSGKHRAAHGGAAAATAGGGTGGCYHAALPCPALPRPALPCPQPPRCITRPALHATPHCAAGPGGAGQRQRQRQQRGGAAQHRATRNSDRAVP